MKIPENKLLLSLSLIVFVALTILTYFAYPIIKERYFTEDGNSSTINNDSQNNYSEQKENDANNQEAGETDEDNTSKETGFIPEEETTTFREIEKKDCANGCTSFETSEEKDYCLKVCNSHEETEDIGECSEKEGLEKDFCHKVLGIKNKDFEECKKIKDSNIRESCISTVAEEILERGDPIEEQDPPSF